MFCGDWRLSRRLTFSRLIKTFSTHSLNVTPLLQVLLAPTAPGIKSVASKVQIGLSGSCPILPRPPCSTRRIGYPFHLNTCAHDARLRGPFHLNTCAHDALLARNACSSSPLISAQISLYRETPGEKGAPSPLFFTVCPICSFLGPSEPVSISLFTSLPLPL